MLTFVMQPFSFCEKYGKHSSIWHKGSDFPADAWETRLGCYPFLVVMEAVPRAQAGITQLETPSSEAINQAA